MATMAPTIPPLVTTTSPFCSDSHHLLLLLALALHGHEQQEIEDGENQEDRKHPPSMPKGEPDGAGVCEKQ